MERIESMKITGLHINYYFICKRKLWCMIHQLKFEDQSEAVLLGKLLDEQSYEREQKHIVVDETINIDFIQKWKVLHEVKKSKAIEEASIWQVKYYLYFMEKKGIFIEQGILDYPNLKQRQVVHLTDGDRNKFVEIIKDIHQIAEMSSPPVKINQPMCKKCAYYEYCYI